MLHVGDYLAPLLLEVPLPDTFHIPVQCIVGMSKTEELEQTMQSVEDFVAAPGLCPLPLKVYAIFVIIKLLLTCTDLRINTQVEVAGHVHLFMLDGSEVGIKEVAKDLYIPQGQMIPLGIQQAVH